LRPPKEKKKKMTYSPRQHSPGKPPKAELEREKKMDVGRVKKSQLNPPCCSTEQKGGRCKRRKGVCRLLFQLVGTLKIKGEGGQRVTPHKPPQHLLDKHKLDRRSAQRGDTVQQKYVASKMSKFPKILNTCGARKNKNIIPADVTERGTEQLK